MIGDRIGHRTTRFSVTGSRVTNYSRGVERSVFDSATAENNPAMNIPVPPLNDKDRDWRFRQKPCDNLGDVFLPEEEFVTGVDETEYEREQTREHYYRYIADQCRKNCPFLGLCSREAILSAQMLARMQGSPARLYGVWGGIIFRGREGRPQYQNKLERLYEQATGETTWEPLNSNPTAPPSQSESQPSARDTSGQNSAMTTMSIPAESTSGSLPEPTVTECSLNR